MKSQALSIASLAGAAIVGGYALASAVAVFLGAVLPLPRAEAVLAATLLSFAIYTGAVIWVFAARDARRAWLGLLLPAALLTLAGLWLPGVLP